MPTLSKRQGFRGRSHRAAVGLLGVSAFGFTNSISQYMRSVDTPRTLAPIRIIGLCVEMVLASWLFLDHRCVGGVL